MKQLSTFIAADDVGRSSSNLKNTWWRYSAGWGSIDEVLISILRTIGETQHLVYIRVVKSLIVNAATGTVVSAEMYKQQLVVYGTGSNTVAYIHLARSWTPRLV